MAAPIAATVPAGTLSGSGAAPVVVVPGCAWHGCPEAAIARCECCIHQTRFCDNHGSPAHYTEREGIGSEYPAACWKCGGFNFDE